jgi:hypothetical protein
MVDDNAAMMLIESDTPANSHTVPVVPSSSLPVGATSLSLPLKDAVALAPLVASGTIAPDMDMLAK